MSVRNLSARTSAGLRMESAGSPLYPTRPDPTRPSLMAGFHHVVQIVTRAKSRDGMMPADIRTADRFGKYATETPSGCWLWIGLTNQAGYGRLWDGSRLVGAHRYAYEIANGSIPDGLEVGHLCHNPSCVNPSHLRAMTHAENLAMRYAREGAPSAELGRPMTSTERGRRCREKKRQESARQRRESGWWVSI